MRVSRRTGWWIGAGALLLPRLARLAAPWVRVEDPNYAYAAYLVSRGWRPHLDFAQPNLPYLEYLLGALFRLCGPWLLLPELLSALAAWVACLLVAHAVSRRTGAAAGWAVGLLMALHPLLLRYHLFEREVFVLPLALGALVLVTLPDRVPARRAALAGLLLAAAVGVKQSGVLPLGALAAALALRRDGRGAAWLVLSGGAGVAALVGLDLFLHGPAAYHQILTFHSIKGMVAPLGVRIGWVAQSLGWLALPGAIGGILAFRSHPRLASACWLWIGAELLFDLGVSSTLWPHYMIPLLAPLALLLGIGWGPLLARSSARRGLVGVCLAVLLAGSVAAPWLRMPDRSLAWSLGWGGTRRGDLRVLAAAVRGACGREEAIVAPPYEALAADRLKRVAFKDNWGLMLWMEQALAAGRMEELRSQAATGSFGVIRVESARFWLGPVAEDLRAGTIPVVVPNYELLVPEERLAAWGYRPIHQGPAGTVLVPAPRRSSAAVEETP